MKLSSRDKQKTKGCRCMIYVFLADGCEEIEALMPVDILRRAGLRVVMVGVGSKTILGSHGIRVICDCSDAGAEPSAEIQAVVLPGGMPGTLNLERSSRVQAFVDRAVRDGKLICAICAAPSVLGHKNLLAGRRATCFPGFEQELYGALCSDAAVVRDGNIITAKGMGAALRFSLAVAEEFIGKEAAERLGDSLQIRE